MVNRTVNCKMEPSRRELFGGLTVLTVLACVLVSRDGRPRETLAERIDANPIVTPAVLVESRLFKDTTARQSAPASPTAIQVVAEQSSKNDLN